MHTVTTITVTTTTADSVSLHLLSLAPAAVGLCCLAADRRRARALELFAAAIMMLAMADAALSRLVAPVWWCAALLATAVALAAVGGRARSRAEMPMSGRHPADAVHVGRDTAMGVHAAGGLVVMAALLLAMTGDAGTVGASGAGAIHRHGSAVAGPAAAGVVLAVAYVIGSILIAVRARRALDRVQYAAMAASVALMSVALAMPASA